jgi:hypothetical protein
MKIENLLSTLIIASIILITGCKKDDFVETIGVCPVVESTSPINNATNVPLDKIITATFNEKMNPSTITTASFTVQGTAPITGIVTYSGTTATFTPANVLTANTTYTAKITTLAKDLVGNAIQKDYAWTFSTGATLTPMVITTDPVNLATSVVLNKIVTASFSMSMDPTTISTTTFTLKQGTNAVVGTVTYSGTTATFTPSATLTANTVYTGTITTGAKNVSGTPLANNYVWTFTTGSLIAPTIISTDPTNNATNVVLSKIITATFSVPMDPLSLTATTFIIKQGTTSVAGIISYSGSTVTFTPSANLLSDATYTGTITTGAKNVAGTFLANDYVWTFSTVAHLGPTAPDLKTAARFGILAGVGISNDAGPSVINNLDVGISPGALSSVSGFPPATIVGGAIYAADAGGATTTMLTLAKQELTDAYNFAAAATLPAPAVAPADLGGKTLAPGIYYSTSTMLLQNGDLTLDGQGDANAVWIFKVGSAFTSVGGAGGNVILAGGAQAKNVYWQISSSATIGDYTTFYGNILALSSITMGSHSVATGRMLARNAAVTLTSTNTINKP